MYLFIIIIILMYIISGVIILTVKIKTKLLT